MFRNPARTGRWWTWLVGPDGGRRRVPLHTKDKAEALAAEALLGVLVAHRAWGLVEHVTQRTGGAALHGLARAWKADGLAAIREAEAATAGQAADPDLRAYVAGWQTWMTTRAKKRATAATAQRRARQLGALFPMTAPFPVSAFTRKAVEDAMRRLEVALLVQPRADSRGPGSTVQHYAAAWSSFGTFLVRDGVLAANPVRLADKPEACGPRRIALARAESERLVLALPEPWRTLCALQEGAGAEFSAALAVRREDLDPETHTVRLRGTKTRHRDRRSRLEDWAWPLVWATAKEVLRGPILRDATGRAFADLPRSQWITMVYKRYAKAWRAARAAVGIRADYRPHDARHSFAQRWVPVLGAGVVGRMLGHRDGSMVTEVYDAREGLTPADLQRMATAEATARAAGHNPGHNAGGQGRATGQQHTA